MGMRGSGSYTRLTEVNMALSADTPEALTREMLLNNVKYGVRFGYTDFTQSPIDKRWYCWYLIDIELYQEKSNTKPLRSGDTRSGSTS